MVEQNSLMLFFEFRRKRLLLVSISLIFSLVGCSFNPQFIFYSSREVLSTPDQAGMNYEEIWFEAEDGTKLHGWYIPSEFDRPLVVFFHGNAANISHRVPNLQFLHRFGLPVFIFDYRGFGASKGHPRGEEDLYQDARGALKWLQKRGWNPDRMIYFGRSLGASVALQAALENPPGGVVLEAPFTSLREIAKETSPITFALFGWWSIGDHFDNEEKIPHLLRPLLIFHGDQDQIVPHEMSLRLFTLANRPKTLSLISGARHSDAFQIDDVAYSAAWRNFISQVFGTEFSQN